MLVDLMLAGMSGFDCIREVRRSSDVPIVVVSARDDTHDIVAGLEVGADDYLTKPFEVKEMTARLRALRRRVRDRVRGPAPRSVFGELVIRTEAGLVRRGGRAGAPDPHRVPAAVRAGRHAGRVLSRQQLLERVWDYDFRRRAARRRARPAAAAQDRVDPANPRHLVTVRGLGYKLQR